MKGPITFFSSRFGGRRTSFLGLGRTRFLICHVLFGKPALVMKGLSRSEIGLSCTEYRTDLLVRSMFRTTTAHTTCVPLAGSLGRGGVQTSQKTVFVARYYGSRFPSEIELLSRICEAKHNMDAQLAALSAAAAARSESSTKA